MRRYGNRSGKSGVVAYELRPGAITVVFRNGDKYLYTQPKADANVIAEMQALAVAGEGLSTYISQRNPPFERL